MPHSLLPEAMPDTMNVVEIREPGGPEVLRLARRPVPLPGPGQILIRVAAAGVNRADTMQRAGAYPPPEGASDLPGLEAAGKVAATGEGVTQRQPGDRVTALLPGGGYAEYALCPSAHALPVPEGVSMIEAACLPEACFTVWSNVMMRAGLRPGERFLVHGGSSGIGTTAIQLARLLGARVFATAGTDEKCAACERLGAERAINYRKEDFSLILREAGGADVILDMVGGDYFPRNLAALAPEGRLQMISFMGGAEVSANVGHIMRKRLTISGSTLRPQPDGAKAAIAGALRETVWPWLEDGRFRPVVDSTWPFAQAAAAHARIESSAHVGKIILVPEGGG